jgi:putative DNA primase/helicase
VIRFHRTFPCPVCAGFPELERGKGERCCGFTGDDPSWAHCTRPEHAGDLKSTTAAVPTYAHRLIGECRCGTEHGIGVPAPVTRASKPPLGKVTATYTYESASGATVYRVCRYAEPKDFRPMHPTEDGGWAFGLNGVARVLYGLPALIAAPGRALFVVEGEKDADRLRALGLLSTTNCGGADSWQRHAAEYAKAFVGRSRVVVIPDNDPPGKRWAAQVAASAASVDGPVYVLELDGLSEGGDVSDWLDAGHSVDELKARVAEAPRWTPVAKPSGDATLSAGAVRLSDVQPEAVEWLWPGRYARGKITLIDGDPGQGKSVLTTDTAARVTTGKDWPDGQPCRIRGSVLLLGAEDGLADTVRPRLDAAGADTDQVYALPLVGNSPNEHQPSIPDDIDAIEAALVATGAVLLVVDPLMAYLDGKVNSYRDQDVRRALAPLAAMAERLKVADVVIRHLNKSSGGPAIYRGGGSIGLAGAARIVLAVGADPEDESRRILAPVKANLSAPSPSLAYRLVEASGTVRVDWLGTSDVTAERMLAAPVDDDERSALGDACDFLRDQLADGPVAVVDVEQRRKQAGISSITYRRARTTLGVLSSPSDFGGKRMLHLPAEPQSRSSNLSGAHSKAMSRTELHEQHRAEPDVITRSLPHGMRHSACPRCGAVATVLAAAADSLCAGCVPLTPRVTRRWPQPASAGG